MDRTILVVPRLSISLTSGPYVPFSFLSFFFLCLSPAPAVDVVVLATQVVSAPHVERCLYASLPQVDSLAVLHAGPPYHTLLRGCGALWQPSRPASSSVRLCRPPLAVSKHSPLRTLAWTYGASMYNSGRADQGFTTGFRRFAGYRMHPANATLHSAKRLSGAALDKEPPAKN